MRNLSLADPAFLAPKIVDFDTDALAWFAAVEATGANFGPSSGAITNNKIAFNTLISGLKSNSIWTPLIYIHPCIGVSTFNIPPIKGTGQTITGFVSGDFSPTTGLKGGTGRVWFAGSPNIDLNTITTDSIFMGSYTTLAESSINNNDILWGQVTGVGRVGRSANLNSCNRQSTNTTLTGQSQQNVIGLVSTNRFQSTNYDVFSNNITATYTVTSIATASQLATYWANTSNTNNTSRSMAFPMLGNHIPSEATLNTLLTNFISSLIWV